MLPDKLQKIYNSLNNSVFSVSKDESIERYDTDLESFIEKKYVQTKYDNEYRSQLYLIFGIMIRELTKHSGLPTTYTGFDSIKLCSGTDRIFIYNPDGKLTKKGETLKKFIKDIKKYSIKYEDFFIESLDSDHILDCLMLEHERLLFISKTRPEGPISMTISRINNIERSDYDILYIPIFDNIEIKKGQKIEPYVVRDGRVTVLGSPFKYVAILLCLGISIDKSYNEGDNVIVPSKKMRKDIRIGYISSESFMKYGNSLFMSETGDTILGVEKIGKVAKELNRYPFIKTS
jgi:hypothetical protein